MLVYFPQIFRLFFILIDLHAYSEVFATEPCSIDILFFHVSKASVKFDLSVFHKSEIQDYVLCPVDPSSIIFSIFPTLIWYVPNYIEEVSIV
jgi:hypothetical protein